MYDDTALIGAPFGDDAGTNSGSAYVFTRSGTIWTQQAKLTAIDAATLDEFGYSVAVDDDTALIGARLDDGGPPPKAKSGSAYIFSLAPDDIDDDGVDDNDDFCPDTLIPESVPTKELTPNRWALTNNDFVFDTVTKGNGKGRSYTTSDTAGCSCEQIIAAQGLGKGHTKFGCSKGTMQDWIDQVN